MIPIVTPDEMRAIDAAAPEPVEELIDRAGAAVARAAIMLLEGTYGRRVVVIAGKGNNGADGRAAARRLGRRGVRVDVIDATRLPAVLPPCDLVIDAAYGTGFQGEWCAPALADPSTPVLAVDVPTGLSGLTGAAHGTPLPATVTTTFSAIKPGHVLGAGPELCGRLEMTDIGLDVARARAGVVTEHDVAAVLPVRAANAHKWRHAVWLIAGSPAMRGAAELAATSAFRSGAGYVRRSTPGVDAATAAPVEAVDFPCGASDWSATVLDGIERFAALAVGPGLGTDPVTTEQVRNILAAPVPTVIDGDGLRALSVTHPPAATDARPHLVLTPHDRELARLWGDTPVGDIPTDRFAAVRQVAAALHAVVLHKGSPTIVAHPSGHCAVVRNGDDRLATAGTGDVLTGVIAAFLASGLDPFDAAWAGAWVHGAAGHLGARHGLVASDLPPLIPRVLEQCRRSLATSHDRQ